MSSPLSSSLLVRQTPASTFSCITPEMSDMALLHPRASAALSRLLCSQRSVNAMIVDHGLLAWREWVVAQVRQATEQEHRQGAPVVFCPALTLAQLLGDGYVDAQGVVQQNLGALHQAHGGFLIVTVDALLQDVRLWHLLKTCLSTGWLYASDWRALQPATSQGVSLPIQNQVISIQLLLLGQADALYALEEVDADVGALFRTLIEFETSIHRHTRHEQALMSVLLARVKGDCHLSILPAALAVLCDYSARLGEDATRLALLMDHLEEVLLRAQDQALCLGHLHIDARDILAVLHNDRYEAGRLESEYRHAIAAGWLNIVTEGFYIGQINGLTVYEVARMAFGQPIKITAQASPGNDGLVDIEKEVDLAGPIHTKGMLIVQGYLRGRFMRSRVMALTASVVMEQTYEGVEGDSASAAETLALLSAIAQVPLRQDIAVTGAINQFGDIQAVGGINEKIEGFFRLCEMRGLTGEQGVLIPAVNVQSLMLADEVCRACEAKQFHIWSVSHLDEALTMLTTLPADVVNLSVLEALEAMNPIAPEDEDATSASAS